MKVSPFARLGGVMFVCVAAGACRAPRAPTSHDAGVARPDAAAAAHPDGGHTMASPRFRLRATQGQWVHTVAPPEAPDAAHP